MARKSTAKKTRRTTSPQTPAAATPREKIVAAFMHLLAEKRFETIDLAEIAETAGVSLADLRDEFDGKAFNPVSPSQANRPRRPRRQQRRDGG